MKKLLIYIFGIMFLSAVFTSCKKREDIFRRGVSIFVSDKSIYPLDANITGDILVSDDAVTTLEVTIDGKKVTDVALTDGKASYSFAKTDIGIANIGDQVTAKFNAVVNGEPAAKNITFSMENPLSIDGPTDIPPVDTTIYVKYELADDCTAPDNLVITFKKNSDDAVVLPGTYNMLKDSLKIDVDPTLSGDTLLYTFTFTNANGTVKSEHQLLVIVKRAWDFEEYASWTTDFAPWTLDDVDGLGVYGINSFDYTGEGEAGSWRIFDFATTDPAEVDGWEAHSGTKYAFCMAASGGDNNDWMISDNFDILDGYQLSLYAKSITDAYGLERLIVSVVDNGTGTETVLTDTPYSEVPTDWTNYTYDLSAWAGKNIKVKIGCVSSDAFALFVDDFEIVTGSKKVFSSGFENSHSTITKCTKVIK